MKTQKTYCFKVSTKTNPSKLHKLSILSQRFKKLSNFYLHRLRAGDENIYSKAKLTSNLNTAYIQTARDFAEQNFNLNKDTHFDNKIPVQMDQRTLEINKLDKTKSFNHWAKISLEPYNQINVPILGAEKHFEELKECDFDFQKAILLKKNGNWYINVTVSKEVDIPSEENTEYYMGIDLGINSIASITVMDKDGNEIEHKSYDSGYYMDKIRHFDKRISEFQSNECYDRANEFHNKKRNFIDDHLHKISSDIIDIASKYKNICIVMENLKNLKTNVFNQSKAHNQRLQKWHYRKLQDQLKYKAHLNGISYRIVSPAFTSQVCKHCQQKQIIRSSENVAVGQCQSCETAVNNTDLLASVNLVRRLWFYMDCKSGQCESGLNGTDEGFEGFTDANHYGFVKQLRTH